jgi:hypothetical protein
LKNSTPVLVLDDRLTVCYEKVQKLGLRVLIQIFTNALQYIIRGGIGNESGETREESGNDNLTLLRRAIANFGLERAAAGAILGH